MRVAIVVGHAKSRQGAVAVDGVQEWAWQYPLAEQVVALANRRGHTAKLFTRPDNGTYGRAMRTLTKQINAWRADIVISLHFNAFPEPVGMASVNGTLALHWPTSKQGRTYAVQLSAAVARAQGTRDKGAREQARSWSGAVLYLLRDTMAPAVILETHYGDDATDHEKATRSRDSGLTARAIVDALPRA